MGRTDGTLCLASLQGDRIFTLCCGGFPRLERHSVDDHRAGILPWQTERAHLSILHLRHATPPLDLYHYDTGRVDHPSWRFKPVLQVNSPGETRCAKHVYGLYICWRSRLFSCCLECTSPSCIMRLSSTA